jgi:hypothetical protein
VVLINGRARVVRELVGELNLRSVEAFLMFSSAVQVDHQVDENL